MGDYAIANVASQALAAIGWPNLIGDIEEGTKEAQLCLLHYGQCRRKLLRAAHWGWARKQAPLQMLADSSGNTPNVGTKVPGHWCYEYAFPTDGLKSRFVPWNRENTGVGGVPAGNISIPNTPLVTGLGEQPILGGRQIPALFLESSDFNYPPVPGQQTDNVSGVSPQARTVILTNVKNAELVYTADILYPSVWDSLFRDAFVALLASEIALPIWVKVDRNFGMKMRDSQIPIVQQKVREARVVNANSNPSTSDISVDWMRIRRSGGVWGGGNGAWGGIGAGGDGVFGYDADSLSLASGARF